MAPPAPEKEPEQGVRFSNINKEIEPDVNLDHPTDTHSNPRARPDVPPQVQQELRDLTISMQTSQLQAKRMANFAYEPMSLPPSRAPSPSSGSRPGSQATSALGSPPVMSPSRSIAQSPPLTPAASVSTEERPQKRHGSAPNLAKHLPATITPQRSPPHDAAGRADRLAPSAPSSRPGSKAGSRAGSRPGSRPTSPPGAARKPVVIDTSGVPQFRIGGLQNSAPPSREVSPSRRNSSVATGETASTGLPSDIRGKRPSRGFEAFDPRALFNKDAHRHGSPSSIPEPKKDAKPAEGHRRSGIFSGLYHTHDQDDDNKSAKQNVEGSRQEISKNQENSRKGGIFSGLHNAYEGDDHRHSHSGSMHDLKRFFKFGGHKHKHNRSRPNSPPRKSSKASACSAAQHRREKEETSAVPFADDHGLESKYGKFGKVLGTGAGGSVRLMKRSSDGTTFAVKQFRARHTYETEREYNKKVTAEFCVGSTLHHGNIIETMDIVHEKGNWYEVMEYAPYDLFAIVMTGKMSREEVTCCTMQIINGVSYLHSMGLAHRDLKLDNVVVNERGIMKLIDFGSAVVFRYPFENDVVRASGIVGSDPYLAPEVYDETKYAPQCVDIWSLGIIYCCMALRRFPWKLPRTSDISYKFFVQEPTPGSPSMEELRAISHGSSQHGRVTSVSSHESPAPPTREPSEPKKLPQVDGASKSTAELSETPQSKDSQGTPRIRGPWRLLRLLPRESRYLIGRMLDTDPATRATLEEVQADPWLAKRTCCRQEEGGAVVRAEGHDHVLEPGGAASQDPSKKK